MLPRVVPSSPPALPVGTSSHTTGVYDPKAFLPHAALLRRAFARCARFLHAKPRRAVDHIPVPLWPSVLSDRLPVDASVGRYPTDKLIGRGPVWIRPPERTFSAAQGQRSYAVLATLSGGYPPDPGRSPTCY